MFEGSLRHSRRIRRYEALIKWHSTAEQEAVATWPVRFTQLASCFHVLLVSQLFIGAF